VKIALATGAVLAAMAPGAQAAVNFEPFQPFAAANPDFAAVGDLNNDGISDVIAASSSQVSTLIGNGNGTLQPAQPTPGPGGNITAIAVGDVNGDGRADVAATTTMPDRAWVYISNGSGGFDAPDEYSPGVSPQDVVLANVDSDSDLDMVSAEQGSNSASVFRNDGAGNFTPAADVPTVGQGPTDIAVADFNRDGNNDLAISAKAGASEGISYAEGNGDGTFDPAVNTPVVDPEHLVAADFNGDGRPDLATARRDVGDVVVVTRNAGNTGFDAPVSEDVGPGPGQPERLATADLDGDGDPELAVPHTAGRVAVLIGGAGADFSIGSHEAVGTDAHEVAVGDFNRDGNPDLAVATSGAGGNGGGLLLAIPPTVSITPSIDFGDQQPGVASGDRTITVTNNGAPRLRPGSVTLGGANPGQFTITSNNCTGANLPIGGTCTVGVRFTADAVAVRTATVAIASNGGGTPHVTQLRGAGVLPLPPDGACVDDRNGTNAAETITGTDRGDNIFGFGANDILNGLGGNDCLFGGTGNDRLNGGDGNDTLEGSAGNDVGLGGNGSDRANGGAGRDRISGGAGNDNLNGLSGNDSLSGGTGNDRLTGSTGNDKLTGGAGKNRYSAGSGNDVVNARNRRTEVVDCGSGRDRATVDRRDRVKRCERVKRSRR
jgi:Ca2+-binding RTX toxin-like protein